MRTDWDHYFMQIATVVATRSTCPRRSVGCVLVRDRMLLSTGYNGSIRGTPHCTEIGCMLKDGSCIRTVHAEVNAISQAARVGLGIEGATLYSTLSPCWSCTKQILNTGVIRIVYSEAYRLGTEHLNNLPGVAIVHLV